MDTKSNQNLSNLANIPIVEDGIVYVAVKGSLHANDCSGFGLGQEEIKALTKKFPGSGNDVVNGIMIKTNVLSAINSLGQLGYRIISSTGECDITWTLQPFNGEIDRVSSIIDKALNIKEVVNAIDNSGYVALHFGARNGHISVCKLLLQHGANVNAQTRSGHATPLHKAAAAGKLSTVKFLVEFGASIKMQDIDGQTVLHKAGERKSIDVIKYLLDVCPELAYIKDNKGNLPSTHNAN